MEKKQKKRLLLYGALTAVLASITTATIVYNALKHTYSDFSIDFKDWE